MFSIQLFIPNQMFCHFVIFFVTDGLEFFTPDEYKYEVVLVDITEASSIVFEVEACNDVHLLLMRNADDEDLDVYEIVIGNAALKIFFS